MTLKPISIEIRIITINTVHANTTTDVVTNDLCTASRTRNIHTVQRDIRTSSTGRTSQISDDAAIGAGTGAGDVLEDDVGDVDLRGIGGAFGGVDVEVALIEDDGGVLRSIEISTVLSV